MRSILLGAVAALGLFPTFASAVVSVNVEQLNLEPAATERTVFIEVFGVDLPPEENEQLNVFTIAVNGVNFAPNGVRFQLPASGSSFPSATYKPQSRKFVFRDQGFEFEPGLSNFQSTPTRIQFGSDVIGDEDVANLTDQNNGFIRLPVIIPAGMVGNFPVVVDITSTQLGGAGAPIVATAGQTGGVNIIPEPASLGLIVLGGLLTLRRRRVA